MPYRDDREALRLRNEELEREVAELRRRMEAPPRRVRWGALRVVVPLAVLGWVAADGLVDPEAPEAVASAPTADPAPSGETAREPAPVLTSAASRPRRPSHTASPKKGPGVIDHEYRAVITRTTGAAPLVVGDACTVQVNASLYRPQPDLRWCIVNLACAGRVLREAASVKCRFDEGGQPVSTPLQKPIRPWDTEVRIDRTQLEFVSNREGDAFTLLMDLGAPAP